MIVPNLFFISHIIRICLPFAKTFAILICRVYVVSREEGSVFLFVYSSHYLFLYAFDICTDADTHLLGPQLW